MVRDEPAVQVNHGSPKRPPVPRIAPLTSAVDELGPVPELRATTDEPDLPVETFTVTAHFPHAGLNLRSCQERVPVRHERRPDPMSRMRVGPSHALQRIPSNVRTVTMRFLTLRGPGKGVEMSRLASTERRYHEPMTAVLADVVSGRRPGEYSTVGELRRYAADVAEAVLAEHWPEGVFPVDPIAVCRRMGVEVFTAELGNDVFGILMGSPTGAQIYLDADQPEKRFRFTAGHELGHYVDRSNRVGWPDEAFIDKRSEEGRGSANEIFANEFAANLLMPREPMERYVAAGDSEFALSERFGVSLDALRYRRRRLGI
jgi:hypothetical protein